jgi:hypothetical protein
MKEHVPMKKTLFTLLILAVGMHAALAGSKATLTKPMFVATSKDACKQVTELVDDHDVSAIQEMTEEGTCYLLPAGTIISVEDIGWDGIDTIHVRGKAQTLYVNNHYLVLCGGTF